jgi:hypothetical protein
MNGQNWSLARPLRPIVLLEAGSFESIYEDVLAAKHISL